MTMNENPLNRIRQFNIAVKHPYQLIAYIRCANPLSLEQFFHTHLQEHIVGEHNRELFNLPQHTVINLFETVKAGINALGFTEEDEIDLLRLRVYLVFKGIPCSQHTVRDRQTCKHRNKVRKNREHIEKEERLRKLRWGMD
jgi:hypothetical protein